MRTGKYLYGIVDSKKKEHFGNIGVGNSEVYTIQHEDVGAAVSDVSVEHEIEIEEARAHERALRKIMTTHTIIPISFGTIAKDEAEIKNILKRARMKFKSILRKMRNKLQVNVTISLDKNILVEILREDEEIRALTARAKLFNADQNIKTELGSKVKTALDERKDEYANDIQGLLIALSDEFRESKTTDDYTVIRGSFLVDQSRELDFYKRLNELEKKHEKKLMFLAVGPLPPYDFAKIEIKKMDFTRIEEARKVFGLRQTASLSEIDAAYEQLARKYHPDLNPGDPFAGENFRKIKDAHEVLMEYCEHYLCSLDRSKVEATLLVQEKTDWSSPKGRPQWDEQ